jgi:ribose 5-phosphate isomerase RpiB
MDLSKKIAIGGDHAGFEYKAELIKVLTAEGYEVKTLVHTVMRLATMLILLILFLRQ